MNATTDLLLKLAVALVCFGIGLILFFWNSRRQNRYYLPTTPPIYWLLFCLFPVIVIYAFFPELNKFDGKLLGFAMAGPVAAAVFFWWRGTTKTNEAAENMGLKKQAADLQKQVEILTAMNESGDSRKELRPGMSYEYRLLDAPDKRLVIISGNLDSIKERIDAWVNSENTHMEMATCFDMSVSGTIRYLGAEKDKDGNVINDLVYGELRKQMAGTITVMPATVKVTNSGRLADKGVKKIFHVASVRGTGGRGFRHVDNLDKCIEGVFEEIDSPQYSELGIQSVLFPLLATGQARGNLIPTVETLLGTAIHYLAAHEASNIKRVYFPALFEHQMAACRHVLGQMKSVEELTPER